MSGCIMARMISCIHSNLAVIVCVYDPWDRLEKAAVWLGIAQKLVVNSKANFGWKKVGGWEFTDSSVSPKI